jgi:hypothetical protein
MHDGQLARNENRGTKRISSRQNVSEEATEMCQTTGPERPLRPLRELPPSPYSRRCGEELLLDDVDIERRICWFVFPVETAGHHFHIRRH